MYKGIISLFLILIISGCATYKTGVGHNTDMSKYSLEGSDGYYADLVSRKVKGKDIYYFDKISRESRRMGGEFDNRIQLKNMKLVTYTAYYNFQCGSGRMTKHYGRCQHPTSFHIPSSGFFKMKYTFDHDSFQKAVIQASKNKVSKDNLNKAILDYENLKLKKKRRRIELLEINRIQSENINKSKKEFIRLSKVKKEIGSPVCTKDNKFGFVEAINAGKIKVLISGKVVGKNELFFFGNPSRDIKKLSDFDNVDGKYTYNIVDRHQWDKNSNWSSCSFEI